MKMNLEKWILFGAILFYVSGCSTAQRPVLYDNTKLNEAGRDAADIDIDACFDRAGEAGLETQAGKRAVRQTAGAAAGTAVRETLNRKQLDPTQKRYAEACLREKGYRVVG